MFQLKKRILIVVQLVSLASSACWNSLPNIRTGTFQPISTLTSETSATLNYPVTFIGNMTLPAPNFPINWGLGLVGYQNYLTLSYSFNTTVVSLNSTVLVVTVKPEDGSYLVSLRLYYIVTYWDPATYGLEVIHGCFKCLNISQNVNVSLGLGNRSESFSQPSNLTNSSAIDTRVFLYSFNFSNKYGQTNYLQVSTVFLNRSYSHTVTTKEYNNINYVCLSVISWEKNSNNFGNGLAAFFETYVLNTVNKTQNIYYHGVFDCVNLKFMGFSVLSHSMGGGRVLDVHPESYSNFTLTTTFDSNNYTLEATLNIFYFGSLYCNATTLPLYVASDLNCASSCPTAVYYVNQSNKCVACSSNCFQCDNKDPNNCTQCIGITHRTNSTCICTNGYFTNQTNRSTVCMLCSDYMQFCTLCDNVTVCLNCSSGKFLVNGACQCLNITGPTYLINGLCLTYPGCINATWVTNALYCGTCNTTANFHHPDATNLTCTCLPGYNNNATPTFCLPDCGDGKIVSQSCDDGNLNNTDGCNSTCQVVPGWYCFVNSTTNASSCLRIQSDASITYLYAQRIIGTNTALLFFTFQPAGKNMDPYVFKNAITTDAPLSTITPTYNAANSSINLLVAFKEDIQGNAYNFTFAFTSAQVYYSQPISAQVIPQGINQQLKFESYGIVVKTMQYTLMGTAFLGLGLGVVCAAAGYKLMGLELLLPMQAGFFAEFGMTNPPPYVSTLKNLKYSLGYNQLLPYDYSKYVGSNSKFAKFDFQIEMALNINIMAVVLVLATVVLLILQIIYLYRYSAAAQEQRAIAPPPPPQIKKNGKGKKEEKEVFEVKEEGVTGLALKAARQRRNAYVNNFYFYLSASLAQQTLFCFIIQNSQFAVSDFYLSEDINIMAGYSSLLLMMGNLVFMLLQWGEKKDRRIITFNETRVIKYPIFLVLSCLMMALAMAVTMTFSFSAYIASALGALPLIGLIYFRPYRHEETKLNAFSAFINLAFPMVASATYLVNNIMTLSQFGWVISVGIIVIWQFATEATTIIRMVKTIPWRELPLFEKCVKKKRRRSDDDGLLEKTKVDIEMTSMVKNSLKNDGGQIIDWEQKNKKEYESISQKPDNDDAEMSQHNEEEDELAQLKRRLKKEITMKKAH